MCSPGQHHGLERVGKVVDVQHFDVVQVGHLVQVEVVGHHLGFPLLGQLEQLQIDLADRRKVVGHNLHLHDGVRLHALQHVEAAASALPFRAVGGVGHDLQLAQHELRHHHHAVDKSGLGDIGDAPVDNHAGVEHLGAAPGWAARR